MGQQEILRQEGFSLRRVILFVFLVVYLFLLASVFSAPAHAQLLPPSLSLDSTPVSPSPGKTFSVKAVTLAQETERSFFEWSVNGKPRNEFFGYGKNLITLEAGPAGSIYEISVITTDQNGKVASASLRVTVSDLSLTWFASNYIPRWYKGKTISSQGSVITFVAVPRIVINRKTVSPKDLFYTWNIENREIVHAGLGTQTFSIALPDALHITKNVRVRVEDFSKQIKKSEQIFVVTEKPRLVLYQSTPLGGIRSSSALPQSLNVPAQGFFDITAEPFFFPVRSKSSLSYEWKIDAKTVESPHERPYLISFNLNKGAEAIKTDVSLSVYSTQVTAIPRFLKSVILLHQ